jgi:TonB family protein
MSTESLTPPELVSSDKPTADESGVMGHELDNLLGRGFEEKSVFVDLWENLHDLFFPPHLPPLELTSTPIPVPDPMKEKRSPVSLALSTAFNISLVILLIFVGHRFITPPAVVSMTPIDLNAEDLLAKKNPVHMGGGGGGGENSKIEAEKGKTPKQDLKPLAPPEQPKINPTLAVESAVLVQPDIKLPDNPNLTNIGVKNSANVTLASAGTGGPAGLGSGHGNGDGPGSGSGNGPGSGGNTGGGVYSIGGDVAAPKLISSVDPEFTDEARRAKYQGVVIVGLIVDAQGNPQNVHVIRAIGYGLDEKAVEAVKQYKFKPAIKQGKGPVPVQLAINVNFRIY